MENNRTFYGTADSPSITYLEFGEIDIQRSEKKVWEFKLHQKAYDWLMLGRYSNDLLAFSDMRRKVGKAPMQELIECYNREVHHPDEASLNLSKLIALAVVGEQAGSKSFYELGQTIFGCIEGMEFYRELLTFFNLDFPFLDLKGVEWYGVDISDMFNRLAKLLHQDYKVNTYLDPSELPEQVDVFFSKGISLLYAVRDVEQFFNTVGKGRIAIFDYSLSLDGAEDTTIGSGKTVRYLDYSDVIKAYRKRNRVLFVKENNSRYIKDKNRVWLDCLYSDPESCERFIQLDTSLRKELYSRLSALEGAGRLLNREEEPRWLPIDTFIKESGIPVPGKI